MFKILSRFYQFLVFKPLLFGWFVVVLLITIVAENINPYFYKLLVDAIPSQDYGELMRVMTLYVGLIITSNLVSSYSFFLGNKILIPAAREARIRIFRYIQDLDFAFHVDKNTGSLISAFKRGDGAFFEMFFVLHYDILNVMGSLVVVLFFFSKVSMNLLPVMMILFAINVFLSLFLIRINLFRRAKMNAAEDKVSGIITDNLLNYETVKFFAQEEKEEKRLRFDFIDWTEKIWSFVNSFRMMDVTTGTVSAIGMFLVFQIAIKKLVAREISTGDFVMVTGFITSFYYRFFRLTSQMRRIAKHYIDLKRYFGVLDNEIAVKDPVTPIRVKHVEGNIDFNKVSFSYPGNKRGVLSKIDLSIKQGESVALVGRSGAGKSTIVKLLLRFYDVKRGEIKVDGVDIKKMTKSDLRTFIGVVPQEPILFNNTIAFNIGYGKGKAKLKEIKKAAKMANLDEFVNELPKKYKTEVGERGIKLSGGQKQRLAIARALLVNPPIIVFDEATSNLDSESEKEIQKALWGVAENRTMIIIAHRFSTIIRADRIVVMDKGQIVETGTHQDLVNYKEGIYRKLWELQIKGKLEKDEGGLLTKS